MLNQDDSMMTHSDKLAYISEIRETFGEDAAQSLADELGLFLPGIPGGGDERGDRSVAARPQS